MKEVHINPWQMYVMIFLLKLCNFITYTPAGPSEELTLAGILGMFIGSFIVCLMLLPFYFLIKRYPGMGILECSDQISPIFGKIVAAFFFLVCLLNTSYAISQGEMFFTSAISVGTYPPFIIACFIVASMYAAKLGIEAICRSSMAVFYYFLITTTLIVISLVQYWDPLYLNPLTTGLLQDNWTYLVSGIFTGNFQFALLFLMIPYVKGNFVKGFPWYLLFNFLALGGLVLMEGMTLGRYASVKIYPFYSMVSIARLSFFDRMDALHMVTWIAMTFVKTSILLFFASECLHRLLPGRLRNFSLQIASLLTFVLSVMLSYQIDTFLSVGSMRSSVLPTLIVISGIPLLILLLDIFKKHRKKVTAGEIS